MYKKNIGLALLELAFSSPTSLLPPSLDAGKPSYRVIQLYLFIEQNVLQRATFDDAKEYVAQLTFQEAKYFIDNIVQSVAGKVSTAIIHTQLGSISLNSLHRPPMLRGRWSFASSRSSTGIS